MLWNEIKKALLRSPEKTVGEDRVFTFAEFAKKAEDLSKKLIGAKCCAILCRSETQSALWLCACFAAGVTAVPLSLRYGKKHCDRISDFVLPDLLLSDEDCVKKLRGGFEVPETPAALIMCTSGTTGDAKGVILSEKNVLANVGDIVGYFGLEKNERILISRPLYHCAVLTGEFLAAIFSGTDIRFYSGEFNPSLLPSVILRCGADVLCGTPTTLSLLAASKRKLPLKKIAVSGEKLDAKVGKKIANAFPDAEIFHVYGLTEASPRVAFLPPSFFGKYPDCVGFPLPHTEIKIEDGILKIRGDNVTSGYYKSVAPIEDGWLSTGDCAKFEDGLLKILGRRDGMINRFGMNVYPSEPESILLRDGRVREVMAYGFENKMGIALSGDFSSEREVYELCKSVLPRYMLPNEIFLLDRLEKNGSGKLIRKRPDPLVKKPFSAV